MQQMQNFSVMFMPLIGQAEREGAIGKVWDVVGYRAKVNG